MNYTGIVNAILAARNHSAAAFDRFLPEIEAVDPKTVRILNVEAPTAVARVLGAAPKILALSEDISRHLPTFNTDIIFNLEDCAYSVQECNVRCLIATKAPDELIALGEEGDLLRDLLRSDSRALVNRGLIDGRRLASYSGLAGYKTIATDLGVVSGVMLDCWEQIQGKCAVTEEDLHRAQAIAEALLAYVGLREQSPEAKAAALQLRDKAFTLLVNNYDEIRRAVTYLRWHEGDAEEVAPSLYAGKRRSVKEEEQPAEPVAAPTTPAASPTTPAAPAAPATPATPATPSNGTPAVTPAVPAGGPNANPFLQ